MVKNVLVVDDSEISRLMLRAIIENYHPDWRIMEAGNAREAERICESNDLDIITLDLNMPGVDGLTVAPKLKAACPKAKIALLTANFQDRIRAKAESQGLVFIPKPISEEKILQFVER